MKFSYSLIKKLVPGVKSKSQIIEILNSYAFETEDGGGDVIEVTIPANRYSDAASHWGIAREVSAILGLRSKIPYFSSLSSKFKTQNSKFKIEVQDENLCPRYMAQYFENVQVKPSPPWMQKILIDCGLRPINNVVDIMNYVMLETGQPLHAFDADKLEGKSIIIRRAKKGETFTSLEGIKYNLSSEMLVIADAKKPQALAGIKGGQDSAVGKETKNILVESANFDSISVYKTAKALNLNTDASIRFSHGLSLFLPAIGLKRAATLLKEIAGAQEGEKFDSLKKILPRRFLTFDMNKFNKFIGLNLKQKEAEKYLIRLGFKKVGQNRWEVPPLRMDIEDYQDLAEEVIRLYGYHHLKSQPPQILLKPAETDETVLIKNKIRFILTTLGLDEVYNYSFSGKGEIEILNPSREDKKYLRASLKDGLLKNIEDNFRFFETVRIFEIGHIFLKKGEKLALGLALGSKKEETFFELKGIIVELLKGLGVIDFFFNEWKIEANYQVIGMIERLKKGISLAELDVEKILKLAKEEFSFEPLPKFPSVVRDISILISNKFRIGEVMEVIQNVNPILIQDVDLIDEYIDEKWGEKQSLTFRIIFQHQERTLSSEEVNKEMEKISNILQEKFGAQIR